MCCVCRYTKNLSSPLPYLNQFSIIDREKMSYQSFSQKKSERQMTRHFYQLTIRKSSCSLRRAHITGKTREALVGR